MRLTLWPVRVRYIQRFAKTWRSGVAAAIALPFAILIDALTSGGLIGFVVIWVLGWLAVALWADRWEQRTAPVFRFSSSRLTPVPNTHVREDENAQWYIDRGGFLWRKRIWFAATGIFPEEFERDDFAGLAEQQEGGPVKVIYSGRRQWWWFGERFYAESQGYQPSDVKALILERERHRERRLERAHDLLAVGNGAAGKREPIPDDVKRFVFRRDAGRCVKCGSNELIQFDHIIPLALGGANTADNLQILCTNCNREKADAI